MKALFTINVGLRFLLEVFNTLALIFIGLTRFDFPSSLLFGILIPLICVSIWAMLIAPKAKIQLPVPAKFIIELVIFATVFIYLTRVTVIALAFAYLIVVIANSIIAKIADKLAENYF